MMIKKILWVLLGIAIVAGFFIYKNRESNPKGEWMRLKKGPIIEAVYGIGTVTPKYTYQVKTAIATTVEVLYVEEGQRVKKGQKLALLDTLFKAPFTGTITSILYKTGETVNPQTSVLTLVDLRHCYMVVNIEQQGAVKLRIGQEATLSFESLRDRQFVGSVKHIYSNNGQFLVHIDCPNLQENILPGMTADVAITLRKKNEVLTVPIIAIKNGSVTRRRNKQIAKIAIKTGTIDSQMVEVINSDLQDGDDVWVPNRKRI